MHRLLSMGILLAFAICMAAGCLNTSEVTVPAPLPPGNDTMINLPDPRHESDTSLEEALLLRRTIRSYTDEPLTPQELGQLLWAAQGITEAQGRRTAPSAGALYPLEVRVVIGNVNGISPGIYRYIPQNHQLALLLKGDLRDELSAAALRQISVQEAPASIIISAIPERTTVIYGDRGMNYIYMEAGHAAQNVYLQAVALDLGTVSVGSFDDEAVKSVVGLVGSEIPLYIMPVGHR
jgi:SagB-type dehydrogenase family enzyme